MAADCAKGLWLALRWAGVLVGGVAAAGILAVIVSGSQIVTSSVGQWWLSWLLQPAQAGASDGWGFLGAMVGHALVSVGLLAMALTYPVLVVMQDRFGLPERHPFGALGWALAVLIVTNPVGWQAGQALYNLNMDALAYAPAFILIGRAVDSWWYGSLSDAPVSPSAARPTGWERG
jgi:hypothetical protein